MKLIYVSFAKDPDDRQREIDGVRFIISHNEAWRLASIRAWNSLKAKKRALIVKEYGQSGNFSNFMRILENEQKKRRNCQ